MFSRVSREVLEKADYTGTKKKTLNILMLGAGEHFMPAGCNAAHVPEI